MQCVPILSSHVFFFEEHWCCDKCTVSKRGCFISLFYNAGWGLSGSNPPLGVLWWGHLGPGWRAHWPCWRQGQGRPLWLVPAPSLQEELHSTLRSLLSHLRVATVMLNGIHPWACSAWTVFFVVVIGKRQSSAEVRTWDNVSRWLDCRVLSVRLSVCVFM